MMRVFALALLLCATPALSSTVEANPIRKIVTLLQDMSKEIEAEGAKEKELFDKFYAMKSSSMGSLMSFMMGS